MTEAYNLVADASEGAGMANASGDSNVSLAATSFSADALYTNTGAEDFTLQNTSPAINRGCNLGAAGDNTECDAASDGAQPDLTAGANPNYYGFAPDLGAFENTLTTTCAVSSTADASPTAPYGSLRDCLNYASANAGTTIKFAIGVDDAGYQIAGADNWWKIAPVAVLPTIDANGTIVDGATQTSYLGDVNSLGPEIEIDGGGGAPAYDGFNITSANNTIRALIVNRYNSGPKAGISINGVAATNNTVSGNYIGTDYKGTVGAANGFGIIISGGAQSNTVGGTSAAERNVISGNTNTAIEITGANTDLNMVQGNYIGTDAAGTASLGNNRGVFIDAGAQNNTIGGSVAGARNLISGNFNAGVEITNTNTNLNKVQGNFIGTDVTGTASLNNSRGVFILSGAQSNTIGGTASNEANTIAFNSIEGIFILGASTDNNTISGNAIFSNTNLGINLAGSGANNDQAAPIITVISPNVSDFDTTTTLTANGTLEFFRVNNTAAPAVTPDGSGAGEGFLYLGTCADNGAACSGPHISGSDTTASDSTVTVTLTSTGLSANDFVTATTTDATNGTSEFSTNVLVPSVIDISGTCKQVDQTTNCTDTGTLRVAVNGSLQAETQPTVGGTWTISSVTVNSGDVVTVFIESAADANEAVAVTKYDGTGNITGVDLFEEHLSIGSDDNQTLSNADLNQYDNALGGEDVFHDVDNATNDLTVDITGLLTQEELYIKTGNTYQPDSGSSGDVTTHDLEINGTLITDGNTLTLNGSWDNNGVLTAGTSTVHFTAASGTELIDSTGATTANFNHLTLNDGAGTATFRPISALDIDGTLSLTDGIFDLGSNDPTLTTAGNVTIATGASIDVTARTANWTFDGTSILTDASSGGPQDLEDVVVNGTSLTLGSSAKIETMTITNGILNLGASSYTLEIDGTGTPLSNSGTFTAGTSTVNYTGSGTTTNVTTVAYDNLMLTPTSATAYNLTGNLTGANALTGSLVINTNATLDAVSGSDYNITLSANWSNSGTFTARAGTVLFDGTNHNIAGSTTFNNFSKTDSTNDSTDLTLTFDNLGTQTINGTFTLNGLDADDRINLVSDNPSNQWSLVLGASATKAIDFVDVTDSDASGSDASQKPVNPTSGVDSGNNIDWFSSFQLVKVLFQGDTCLASSDADAACNGGSSSLSVPTGVLYTFVIYISNTTGSAATDIRFQDNIDDVSADYFEFQPNGFAAGQGMQWATTGSGTSTKAQIKTALNAGTPLSNAFDGSTGTNEYCGINTGVSPDQLICGGDAVSPNNDQIDVAAGDTFAMMFNFIKRD